MALTASRKLMRARISEQLLVFAWNLPSLDTPFARHSLALNTIEKGRAWHWTLLPPGWINIPFILCHGQIKTKLAFAAFFPKENPRFLFQKRKDMRLPRMTPPEGVPLAWETVKDVFARYPTLKRMGVLAGAQALVNEHLENRLGRFSFDIDLHTNRSIEQAHALLTPAERKKIRLVSRANPEMYVYSIATKAGPIRLEVAKPYLRHKRAPSRSKHIPGLKVAHLADLIDAKISALSTRGFMRDLVDLYAANQQQKINWVRLFTAASKDRQNDYSPVEMENNLQRLTAVFKEPIQDLPCERPPTGTELESFLELLHNVNAFVAQELIGYEPSRGEDQDLD
jgi:hypothetical protein